MTLDGTRTYVVGERNPVVIDPGPALPVHIGAILRILDGASPIAIILTHAHSDHAGGAKLLADATSAPVRMAAGAIGGSRADIQVDQSLDEGDEIETDAGTLRVVRTPGHTPEHIALHWAAPTGPIAVFVGDLMMGEGDTSLVAPPEGNLRSYLESLSAIERLRPGLLYPAHGDAIGEPIEAIHRYRRHRMFRIEQVRAALREGYDIGREALIDRVYGPSLDPRLRGAAAGSLEAIVHYLESEHEQ